jgi:hypothetical protein
VLLPLFVPGRWLAVDDPATTARLTVGAYLVGDPTLEGGVQVPLEQVVRLHDMHVTINESQSILHGVLFSLQLGLKRSWRPIVPEFARHNYLGT